MVNIALQNAASAIRVVIVADRSDLREQLGDLLNHANGYERVGSFGSLDDAVSAVRSALEMSTAVNAVLLIQHLPRLKDEYELTPHERRILQLIVAGQRYKKIAASLGVSLNTVSFHVRSIYSKLDVHSKAEAVAKALRNHLV